MTSNHSTRITAACLAATLILTVISGCAAPRETAHAVPASAPVNNAPIISGLTADQQVVQPLGRVILTCQASDAESDNLSYSWTATGGILEASAETASWTAPSNPGSYRVTIVVSDGRGGSATGDSLITVPEKPNNAPVISAIKFNRPGRMPIPVRTNPTEKEVKDTPALTLVKYENADVSCEATDSDKDELAYTWKATGGKIKGGGPNIQWLAPMDTGVYTITCEVSDGKGGTASFTISVTVKCCG